MTLKTKNIILNFTTSINALTALILVYFFILHPELRVENQLILFYVSIIAFIGSIFVFLYFKKSIPTEIILYTIFLVSMSMQSIRFFKIFIESETFMITILIGRIAIFFKYLGLLSLLGASLFSYSIKKQKVGSWLLLTIFASIIISSIIHFNTGIIENNILPKIIFKYEEMIITLSIVIITILTLIKSGFDAKNQDYLYLAAATFFLALSLILTFTSLSLVSGIFIIISLILGSIFYLISIHNITLWG